MGSTNISSKKGESGKEKVNSISIFPTGKKKIFKRFRCNNKKSHGEKEKRKEKNSKDCYQFQS